MINGWETWNGLDVVPATKYWDATSVKEGNLLEEDKPFYPNSLHKPIAKVITIPLFFILFFLFMLFLSFKFYCGFVDTEERGT